MKRFAQFLKLFCVLAACMIQSNLRAQEWPVGSLSTSGIDEKRLNEGVEAIESGAYGNVHSVVIIKDGKLVFERYFNGWKADSIHQMQSATKSVVATFLGIAIQQGLIKDVTQPVLPFYEDRSIDNVDNRKEALTIQDLLTQRHGLKWKEAPWNSPDNTWRKVLETEGDWYKMILSHEMAEQPGQLFNYSNAAPVLTTGIVQTASGMGIDDFAKKYLFDPLGIKKYRFWHGNGGAANNGSALLFLTSRDMAKIGQLYLQHGKWNGQQILPNDWTTEAAERVRVPNIKDNRFYRFGYGYFWWNSPRAQGPSPSSAPNVYAARGAGGQYIIVHPEENMVVVITAWDLRRANHLYEIFPKYIQAEKYLEKMLTPESMPEKVLSDKVETSVAFTPDQQAMYFARKDSFYTMKLPSTIYTSRFVNGTWTEPVVAPFSGAHSDNDPFITSDGKRLFFASNRAIDGNGTKEDRDIWYMDRQGEGWGEPQRLAVYNSNESEYSPTLDEDGNLYFGSYRDGGEGSGDIWVSYYRNGSYQAPVNLGQAINTEGGEWGSSISPDGKYLIFEASGRYENVTNSGDLYVSVRQNNVWQPAVHLGSLNSGASDLTPRIYGDVLYFASNRHHDFVVEMMGHNNVDLYQIDLSEIREYLNSKK